MTPRELIGLLAQLDLDQPFQVFMMNNPLGGPTHPIIIRQGGNDINLNPQ